MTRSFYTLDVFTDTPLGGNPLAIVLDSSGLDDEGMQRIAGEFNLSETVFVFPSTDENSRAEIRIFTPKNELPFAGHPTVGTAILLAALDGLKPGQTTDLVLLEKVGPVSCHISMDDAGAKARFSLPKLPTMELTEFDPDLLAKALNINVVQLGINGHQNSVCNAGVPFPMVPLKDLATAQAINLNENLLEACFSELGFALELCVYTKECAYPDSDYHVRMFAPAMGIAEDPATGSAAAAFAAQIMAFDKPGDGSHNFRIEQGIEMGRPSMIELQMDVNQGEITAASIGGQAVIVSEGKLHL